MDHIYCVKNFQKNLLLTTICGVLYTGCQYRPYSQQFSCGVGLRSAQKPIVYEGFAKLGKSQPIWMVVGKYSEVEMDHIYSVKIPKNFYSLQQQVGFYIQVANIAHIHGNFFVRSGYGQNRNLLFLKAFTKYFGG